ncbi:serine O-acetyltransferase [Paralcaligenes sp. KSB-10]|uniref:serine O-acetyltransferase n=1 Tax=Paralcaligenes sp. KSB-10 TaxID=2901142 RepID=UPI001E493830|nr:serine O-acetyltransferase [Paralcaligenes sp. KSB-10]UHL65585.1 serine O-acetyltransferase [Paralcaligenes sp. KSB-10]
MLTQLREDISCILERDPAARSRLEVLTCYPGLHAILVHRLAHRLWRGNWLWLGRFISHLGRILTGIEIHPGATLGRRVFIDHGFGVVIGETAAIGDDCTIYQGVTLGGTRLYKGEKRHPTLERGVVVGAGAQILGGFTVGEDARIGSNAVVVKPVPAGATAVGNPARIILREDTGATTAPSSEAQPAGLDAEQELVVPDSAAGAAVPTPAATPANSAEGERSPCETDWNGKPLQELLRRNNRPEQTAQHTEGFAPYGVDQNDDDPLVKVLHELINHAASQEKRIGKLCKAMEELGQRVENGQTPLDAERLNRMVE